MAHCIMIGVSSFVLGMFAGSLVVAMLQFGRRPPDPGPIPEYQTPKEELDDMYRLSKSDRRFFKAMAADDTTEERKP